MPSTFPGLDSHFITWQQAQIMIDLYRANCDSILAFQYQGQNILAYSELFNVAAFNALIAVPGCAGIRAYYGMSPDLLVHAIFVATDAQGNDIFDQSDSTLTLVTGGNGPVVEEGQRCPPNC